MVSKKYFVVIALLAILLVPGAMAALPNTSYLTYLAMNGTSGSGTFTDSTGNHAFTRSNGYANISTSSPVFGTGSGVFGIGGNGYISSPADSDFAMYGHTAWTLSLWAKTQYNGSVYSPSIAYYGGPETDWSSQDGGYWQLYIDNGNPKFGWADAGGTGESITSSAKLATNVWYHIEIVRQNATGIDMFLNGNRVATTASASIAQRTAPTALYIAATGMHTPTGKYDGWIDDFVIYNGAWNGLIVPDKELISNPSSDFVFIKSSNDRVSTLGGFSTGTGNIANTNYLWKFGNTSDGTIDTFYGVNPTGKLLTANNYVVNVTASNQYGVVTSSNQWLNLSNSALQMNFYMPANTTLKDASPANHTITSVGNVAINSSYKKFGSSSLWFDGSGDAVTIPVSEDFMFGDEDFTIATWIRFDGLPTGNGGFATIYAQRTDANHQIQFGVRRPTAAVNKFYLQAATYNSESGSFGLNSTSDLTYTVGTWYYDVFTRSGNVWSIYHNGVLVDTETYAYTAAPIRDNPPSIGAFQTLSAAYFYGTLDDFTIIKGHALDGTVVPTVERVNDFSLSAAFACTPTSGAEPLGISCTDSSSGSPTQWSWSFGDGGTSTSEDPTHTYANFGSYDVGEAVSFGSSWDYENKTDYITVSYNTSRFAEKQLVVSQLYPINLYVRDSSTNALIPTAAAVDEYGTSLTGYGAGAFTGNYAAGGHTISLSAPNYYPTTTGITVTGISDTFTATMVASGNTSGGTITYYTPQMVKLITVDQRGVPLVGSSVSANYVATTLPSTNTSWLRSMFGVTEQVANEMLSGGTAMSGVTGTDGSLSFVMFPAIQYNILISNGTLALDHSVLIYPRDTEYTIKCPLSGTGVGNDTLNATKTIDTRWFKLNSSGYYNLEGRFYDPDAHTTWAEFSVYNPQTRIIEYSQEYTTFASPIVINYTVGPLARAEERRWGWNWSSV